MQILYQTERRKYRMGTQKTEKYYTWKGLKQLYDTEAETRGEINELKKKGVLSEHVYAVGFEHKEEAEAFRKGVLDEYIQENYGQFDAAQYDAVVYTDGSFDAATKIGSYGLIIFFRDETDPFIESGTLEDVADGKYKVVRYDEDGKGKEPEEPYSCKSKPGKNGYIAAGYSASGEFLGAKRSLEICCKERGLKKILIIYDNVNVEHEYELKDSKGKDDGGVEGEYREFLREIKRGVLKEDNDLVFCKVDSHKQYPIDASKCKDEDGYKYPHAVYNDLVDILAKAEIKVEIGKVVDPRENSNVFRAISSEFERFSDNPEADKTEAGDRRKYARDLVEKVLKKSDGIFRPKF